MSIFHNDLKEIKCFKITDYDKIIKTSLQDIDNYDDNSTILVELNFFGIDQVYSLMNINKVKEFTTKIKNINQNNPSIYLTRVVGDSPIEEDVNVKTRSIYLNKISYSDLISIFQLNNILEGMNCISDLDIQYDLQIGRYLDEPIIDLSTLDFYPEEDIQYSYILKFNNDTCKFSNEIPEYLLKSNNLRGIFVYIDEFKCWQYISKKKYKSLHYPNNIEIRYAITDRPRCFSIVKYYNLYSISDFYNILLYSIYTPIDIYFKKTFEDINYSLNSLIDKNYEALEICISAEDYTTTVILTHVELGIESIDDGPKILYMDKFCLLELINNIICLKPY